MEEANAFLALREKNARTVPLGVMMCILSPVLLILLSGLSESGKSRLTETTATGLGLLWLFLHRWSARHGMTTTAATDMCAATLV